MNGSLALATIRRMRVHGRQGGQPTAWAGGRRCRCARARLDGRPGFTLIDILVSVAVIAVLVSILTPSLSMVRETTRRLVCASNTRQIGLGLAMYAEDFEGILPPTRFSAMYEAHRLITVRVGDNPADWDGIGWLVGDNYLDAPQVFYCPSHRRENTFRNFASRWRGEPGDILANYHYRGTAPGRSFLALFSEPTVAIVADGMRTREEFNHGVGANVLRIDLSVLWFPDSKGELVASLPTGADGDSVAASRVGQAWYLIDAGSNGGGSSGGAH